MIKRNSWHFWLANFGYSRMRWVDEIDFCTYFRYVVFGLSHLFVLCVLVALISIWGIFSFYDLYQWIVHGITMRDPCLLFIGLIAFIGLVMGISWSHDKYYEWRETLEYDCDQPKAPPKEPGFFTLAYRKFKQKTCFKVKVED